RQASSTFTSIVPNDRQSPGTAHASCALACHNTAVGSGGTLESAQGRARRAPGQVLVAERKQGPGFGELADEIVEISAMRTSGADRVAAAPGTASASMMRHAGSRAGCGRRLG